MEKKKVVVGMSGGVDSSVAAYLLKAQGYDVLGVTMQIWQSEDSEASALEGGCCGLSAVDDARRVAEVLGIPYYVLNFRDIFREKVIDYFTAEYLRGRTPNPCIACNRFVKWEALLQRAISLGADYIATGHYARIAHLPNGRYAVQSSVTAAKDQTYALYSLTQEQLARTLFPVGEHTKEEVRRIAEGARLPVAHKPDSQEICFVPDGDYAGFIEWECTGGAGSVRSGDGLLDHPAGGDPSFGVPVSDGRYSALRSGNYVNQSGEILGTHKGIAHYTVGQRRGLGLPAGERIYVTELRPETNEVVLGRNEDLYRTEVTCADLNWMAIPGLPAEGQELGAGAIPGARQESGAGDSSASGRKPGSGTESGSLRVRAKIRYNHAGETGTIRTQPDGSVLCTFDRPVRAPAPGQAMVFYSAEEGWAGAGADGRNGDAADGAFVLGGGTIR